MGRHDPLFERALSVVLAHEGGLSEHPDDPGGVTQYGISLRYLQSLGVRVGDLDGDGDVDADDVRGMTREQAAAIYRRLWDAGQYAELPPAVAVKLFDLAVNMGARRAVRLLQRALRACGRPVTDDGLLGPQTIRAAWDVHEEWSPGNADAALLAALRSEAAGYYRVLVAKNPRLSVFEHGWLNRAYA